MIVCIAEKPSVGRDIAAVLGADRRFNGYMEGNGYQVTWAFGHLCRLFEPHEYYEMWKRWDLSLLPMIPEHFDVRVSEDEGVRRQFEVIRQLVSQAEMVINCGDAGQEGELIQRWVLYCAGCRCPVKRLWISSLTEESIREGFNTLKDQQEYHNLYLAGYARAIGDWLLGMNATRAYTLRYARQERQVLSVGRVQTPTLALVVRRNEEITHFVPKQYWELKTRYRDVVFAAIVKKTDEEDEDASTDTKTGRCAKTDEPTGIPPIRSEQEGQQLLERIGHEPFEVVSVQKKPGTEYAPRLFDLTSLQVECNRKFGYTAERTLQLIQTLYEKKVTTYPRVDTTYLSDDIYPKVQNILRGIEPQYRTLVAPLLDANYKLPKSKKVFDSSKVTDHHAIIPTGQRADALTEDERRVFDLVARRFVAAFYPECKISTTTVIGRVADVSFKASGRQVLEAGWHVVFQQQETPVQDTAQAVQASMPEAADDSSAEKTLPAFRKGETGEHVPQLVERWTTPPKQYTEATLLRAMETAGRMVDDEELRDAMKENGIGRPSTRASILETLFKRNYIVRKGKSILPTQTGIQLVSIIRQDLLKSAELTGQWERKLRLIERGEYDPRQFLNELKQLAESVVNDVRIVGSVCPKCRQGQLVKGRTAYGCSRWREGCDYRLPFVAGEKVTSV
ncbi:MAG: DNA topoisomerase 3 [Paludibacteraceae bacterium]|nr:DNA topoisomerase 3 [Paludibacteraceae bacterium]